MKFLKKPLPPITPNHFCMAPWKAASIRLESGDIKLCNRFPYYKITNEELQKHGSDYIFNTPLAQKQRKQKLDGYRDIEGCTYCYTLEEKNAWSMRQDFLNKFHENISKTVSDKNILNVDAPDLLAILLDNTCPMKCIYCGPRSSSAWANESEKLGDFSAWKHNIPKPEINPEFPKYFYKWYEDKFDKFGSISILGGETVIQPRFYELLDKTIEFSKTKRTKRFPIGIDSSGMIPNFFTTKLIKYLHKLAEAPHLYTEFTLSMESFGTRAEYIRHGVKWENFNQLVRKVLDLNLPADKFTLGFQTTMNCFCISSLPEFINYAVQLEDEYDRKFYWHRNLVNNPRFQNPFVLDKSFVGYIEKALKLIEDRPHMSHMYEFYGSLIPGLEADTEDSLRNDWYTFVNEYDRRRKTNFLESFPEMTDFYNLTKEVSKNFNLPANAVTPSSS